MPSVTERESPAAVANRRRRTLEAIVGGQCRGTPRAPGGRCPTRSRRPVAGSPCSGSASTVRTVTAEPPPRGRPSDGLLRALAGDAATEALALAAAIPFLFLHATYQPTLSIGGEA